MKIRVKKKMQAGGQQPPVRKPIYSSDMNRVQAYNDSLSLYNSKADLELAAKKMGVNSPYLHQLVTEQEKKYLLQSNKTPSSTYIPTPSGGLKFKDQSGFYNSDNIIYHKNIAPIYKETVPQLPFWIPEYKQPVQPVIYQQPDDKSPKGKIVNQNGKEMIKLNDGSWKQIGTYKKPIETPQPQRPRAKIQRIKPNESALQMGQFSGNIPQVNVPKEDMPFSFTYPLLNPGGDYTTENQRTVRFRNKKEMEDWASQNAINSSQSSNNTMTGYIKQKYGGMNPVLKLALKNFPINYQDGGDVAATRPGTKAINSMNPFQTNMWGDGLIGAFLASQALLNKKEDRNYEGYRNRWLRDYSIPSLVQDPLKHGDEMYEAYKSGGWIAGAVNPAHKGYCSPMTKSTCTPRRKAFARRAKAHFKDQGGMTLMTKEDQAAGYFKHPEASYLNFPGKGERTFVPGPFPLMVKDDNGVQLLVNKPIKTRGSVIEMPIFKDGGEVKDTVKRVKRKDATIEAEKGELIFGAGAPGSAEDQDDRVGVGLFKVGGKKHYEGGTPLKAFPGDFVFSNDKALAISEEYVKEITGKEIKKKRLRTPAKLAENYLELNKFIDMAHDEDLDPITKKTAILNVNNFINKLADISYAQEDIKGFPNGVPEFTQASLGARGFNAEVLQAQLSGGMMKYGGEYQGGGSYPKAFKSYYDKKQKKQYTPPSWITPNEFYAVPGLVDYMKTLDEISGVDNDLKIADDSVWGYRHQVALEKFFPDNPKNKMTGLPEIKRPESKIKELGFPKLPSREETDEVDEFTQQPNNKFNLTAAELYNLYAANRQFPSRYPTAYRNYEIQNAKALTSSSYRPISEQPYLNAIKRSSLGLDQNTNTQGSAGFTRSLAGFNSTLGAENQAISQVYAQNLGRRDAQMAGLANLEIQDGVDRITNQEKYDTKLETLASNKELAAKYRLANNSALLNQMQRDRESKSLFNTMSDYYEIGPNNQLKMKPTYKIENGKLVLVQRNISDLIKQSGQSVNHSQLGYMEQLFQLMDKYNIRNSSFVDDAIKTGLSPRQ